MDKGVGGSTTASRCLAVLKRPEFGPIDFYELLHVVWNSSAEYDSLSSCASRIDSYLEGIADKDQLLRKAAVELLLGDRQAHQSDCHEGQQARE